MVGALGMALFVNNGFASGVLADYFARHLVWRECSILVICRMCESGSVQGAGNVCKRIHNPRFPVVVLGSFCKKQKPKWSVGV